MSIDNDSLPQIPGFTIRKELGRGGMAQVYLGIQDSMDREVAIKVMFPQLLIEASFSERFLREARIAAKLAHPHIVAIIDVGVVNDLHYMAMEYQPGGDLSDRISEGLSENDSMRILKDIATALDYAHSNGFLHRDIKPDNILFSRSGSTVLSDFGIARATDGGTQLTATGSVIGSPHYMSPEQAMGQQVDGRADLYSLGVMFYQMLVGMVPFDGDSAMSIGIKHIRDPIPKLPSHLAKYETFLEKLLAKEPDDRWQSAADVIRSLEILEIKAGPAGGDTLAGTALSDANKHDQVQTTTQVNQAHTLVGQKKKLPLGILISALAVVIIGILVVWQQGLISSASVEKESSQPPVTKSVTPPANISTAKKAIDKLVKKTKVAKPAPKPKPVTKAKPDPQVIELSGYLNEASHFLSPARLSESRLESAIVQYKSAYIMAPGDDRVLRLQEQIASGYEVLADEVRLQKKWDEARRLSGKGLAFLPDHRGLTNLVTKIDRDTKAAKESSSPPRVFGGF